MRVNGPYHDNRTDTWYLKEFRHAGHGGSRRLKYQTEQAALAALDRIGQIAAREAETSVQDAIDQWVAAREGAVKDARRLRVLLTGLLAQDLDRPVARLAPERAAGLYDRLIDLPVRPGGRTGKPQPRSVAYHQVALSTAKEWGRWLVRQKLAKADPFADVEPKGRAKAGAESKVWLDPAQLAKWAKAAEEAIRAGELGDGGLAAYLIYALALRASEPGSMHALQPGQPTRARFRVKGSARQRIRHLWLPLPDWLAPIFEARAEAGLPLLAACRQVSRRAVAVICARAKVPVTCPHGLRESVIDYQTAREAEEGGLDQRLLARMAALHGHTAKVAERHYMQPGRMEEAAVAMNLKVIQGGRKG